MKSLGFTGTQKGWTVEQKRCMECIVSKTEPSEWHHGCCIGSDSELHELLLVRRGVIIHHPPINTTKKAFCKMRIGDTVLPAKDYIIRNHDIVDSSSVLFATPNSLEETLRSGTWATVRYAKRIGQKVVVVYPDGQCIIYIPGTGPSLLNVCGNS